MSIQPVLGPYRFATTDTVDCGCGGDYCTPFINGDTIAFQVADSCCEVVAGCSQLTEACITSETLTSDLTYTQANFNISFVEATFSPDEWILKGSFEFVAATKYMICFCVRGHQSGTFIKAKIGSVESTQEVTGNGNFCFAIDPGIGVDTVLDWGIIVTGGDDSLSMVLECMTLCTYKEWTAELITADGEGLEIPLTRVELNNGNQAFTLPLLIPSEIPTGCYKVKLGSNCSGDGLHSQCLKFTASITCKTLLFKYRNSNDAFGFDYTTDDTYYNYLRVTEARLKNPTFPDDTEIFTKSDNANQLTNARVQKLWKVQLVNLPEFIHSAIAVMRRHNEFYIDGVPFVVADGSYTPDWRDTSDLAHSLFEAYDQSFDGVSTSC